MHVVKYSSACPLQRIQLECMHAPKGIKLITIDMRFGLCVIGCLCFSLPYAVNKSMGMALVATLNCPRRVR